MVGTTACVLVILLALAEASPHRKSADCSLSCEEGSLALKELVTRHDEWFRQLHGYSGFHSSVTFDYVYEGITGSTLDEFPDDALCAFKDITSKYGLKYKLEELGYLQALVEYAYNHMTVVLLFGQTFIQHGLENPSPWTNRTELLIYDEMITDLKASGLLSLNPDGFLFAYRMQNILYKEDELPDIYLNEDIAAILVSDGVINQHTRRIANDLRKVWNMNVLKMPPINGNAGQYLRDQVELWTGFRIGQGAEAHRQVTSLLKEFMEYAVYASWNHISYMPALYEALNDKDVIRHACRAAYPLLVTMMNDYEAYYEQSADNYNGGDNDNGGDYGYGGDYNNVERVVRNDANYDDLYGSDGDYSDLSNYTDYGSYGNYTYYGSYGNYTDSGSYDYFLDTVIPRDVQDLAHKIIQSIRDMGLMDLA